MDSYKIQICVPCYKGQINKHLLKVIGEILKEHSQGSEIEYTYSAWTHAFADVSRNEAVFPSNFMYPGLPFVNFFLLIDADMLPAKQQIYDMVQCVIDNGYHFVSAIYKKNSEKNEYCVQLQPGPSETRKYPGILPVHTIGLGLSVVSQQLLSKIPKPWFNHYFVTDSKTGTYKEVPEDESFCNKVREAGFRAYCNFDIEVKHDIIPVDILNNMMAPIPPEKEGENG